ncbi:uncharacterized protein TRIVIDRAFT_201083 [Trichoderma virens Gv29-8]|uniref:Uncharacterized protein n=1 Tax=Hypocrea virens (strain Gv29-8 / FGSC 10586) TaxID=413071 RepID=G9MRS9_HYPVG|nr:uncharacterized protein TRIVIDRAFT_201083 [Trichoderma virens Gv29-8]EHK22798.1 hypothetical protein TRIVIDRAFT_201083 [Trichoderma virens Gv29-8]
MFFEIQRAAVHCFPMNAKYASRSAVALHASAPKASPSILYLEHPFSWTRRQSPLFTLTVPQDRLFWRHAGSEQQGCATSKTAENRNAAASPTLAAQLWRPAPAKIQMRWVVDQLIARLDDKKWQLSTLQRRIAKVAMIPTGRDSVAHLKQQGLAVTVQSYA